jgi:alpha-mannosidase
MTTYHLVPHTHWDREWYQPFQLFRLKLVHLIDVLLEIFEQDSDFTHFTLDGQTVILEDYLEVRPERADDLKHHIQSGRIIIGPWYVLPDEFLVSPESIVRNLLRGDAICNQFGGRMDVGYLPDPFGHISQMPQILQGFGIEAAAFRRGLADEPCELVWQAPDGSRVLALYLRDGYDNAARMPTEPSTFAAHLQNLVNSLKPHSAVSHILLLNGTDHHEPQPELPSLAANTALEEDELILSSLPAYVRSVQDEIASRELSLPIVYGELRSPKRHHLLAGVLSSRVKIKQRNHTCETLLERWAEPFAAWAEMLLADLPYRAVWTGHLATPRLRRPASFLNEAWRQLLRCHPHDSICGCSIDQVHEEMYTRFDQVEQIGEEIVRQSLTALTSVIDTSALESQGARSALVVFNPNAFERSDITRVKLELAAGIDPFEIIDKAGRIIPYRILDRRTRSLADMALDAEGVQSMLAMVQDGKIMDLAIQDVAIVAYPDQTLIDIVLAENATPDHAVAERGLEEVRTLLADGQHSAFRILARFATELTIEFPAPHIPAHGYRAFGLRASSQDPKSTQTDDDRRIENETIRVEASADGTLSLVDLRSQAEYTGLLRFRDEADRGDSYTFCPLSDDTPIDTAHEAPQVIRRIDACSQTLEARLHLSIPASLTEDRCERSTETVELPIRVLAMLHRGIPRLDLEIHVENSACDHRLQAVFPFPFEISEAAFDGHYQIVHRPTKALQGEPDWAEQPAQENPMRAFIAARENSQGLMIAARGLREGKVDDRNEFTLTLLRCFGWLSRDDLATRKGGAGPQVPVPGGQQLGRHTFHLSVIPFQADLLTARQQAEAFQSPLRAEGTPLHTGKLPSEASLLSIHPDTIALTAVKTAEDEQGLIVRFVNLNQKAEVVELRSLLPLTAAHRARIDETTLGELDIDENNSLHLQLQPNEITTVRLLFGDL